MVKLYYTPSSCGVSSFIAAYFAELNFECESVDLSTHTTESGVDFYTINPKGNVPTLVLDDGTVLNENIVCLEYIADVSKELAPPLGTHERYEFNQLLSYFATEIHQTIGLFFNPAAKDETIRSFIKGNFDRKMNYLQEKILNNKKFVYGDAFTVADSYLHIILSWTKYLGIELAEYPIAYEYYNNICNLNFVNDAKLRAYTKPKNILF
jgi:glutathione S-transferase